MEGERSRKLVQVLENDLGQATQFPVTLKTWEDMLALEDLM